MTSQSRPDRLLEANDQGSNEPPNTADVMICDNANEPPDRAGALVRMSTTGTGQVPEWRDALRQQLFKGKNTSNSRDGSNSVLSINFVLDGLQQVLLPDARLCSVGATCSLWLC